MERSKVYFTDLRAKPGRNLLDKLKQLMYKAGIDTIDMDKKFVAIKIHFGEPGNLAYLRPNYAKAVADVVKELGGRPFLTDCNTLYVGRRKHALEHLDAAMENGFTPYSTGCQVIIADGLKGTDEVEVPVEGGQYVKTAKIGRAIMDADIVISLNHFKGHESAGFGGAIKNLGMGSGSRAGKLEQHAAGKPHIEKTHCRSCHACAKICGQDAISFDAQGKAEIDQNLCAGCGRCLAHCNFDAICGDFGAAANDLNCRMAEYAKAVVQGRPNFHINMVMDVSPNCDCHAENDMPIIPDVGMFASFDAVALDQACADACNNMPPMPGSQLDEQLGRPGYCSCGDHFTDSAPITNWKGCVEHGEEIGLGTREYELIVMK